MSRSSSSTIALPNELIRLGATPKDKSAAIREAGQLLVAAGCVSSAYVDSMEKREAVSNTFLGAGVAIPHGLVEDKSLVQKDGIAVLQVPGGLEWNPGQIAHFIVGIAARSDNHISILRRLTRLIQDEDLMNRLGSTTNPQDIISALSDEAVPELDHQSAEDLSEKFAWVVDYPSGLHARPASSWADAAKASGVLIRVRHENEIADARNMVSLLQLGLKQGDIITVSANGMDAVGILSRFKSIISGLSIKEKEDAARATECASLPVRGSWSLPQATQPIIGVAASPGLTIGTVYRLASTEILVKDHPVSLNEGGTILDSALEKTRQQMIALIDDTTRRLGARDAEIFEAQVALLDDTDLITLTCQLMVAGHGVAWSWFEATEQMAGKLASSGNLVLAARAADIRDIGKRVLGQIDPALVKGSLTELPQNPCIIVASDLSPSDTAGLDTTRVVGLAMALGGPTSHTAILARTLGMPAVVAGGASLMEAQSGDTIIVDGDAGRIYLQPTEDNIKSAQEWIAQRAQKREEEEAHRRLPARTKDGHEIMIGANVNRPDQVPMALAQGGEGVGLMRTEFLFLERGATPSEDEQYETYRGMIEALEGRPLIVRALDIGGDKQVAHLQLPHEENPFLGVRGARLLLRRMDLLIPQLRALYRAAKEGGNLSIMFPMITSAFEILRLRDYCADIRKALDAPQIPIGIMIEVPAAAIQADVFARYVDFFSIGTNDLTQYALAIDRQNPELAAEADSLHPAVLRLIQKTVEGAAKYNRWVGVCGGIAGDPFGAALLAGLGVGELSMTPRDIPAVKARLRSSSLVDLKKLVERALNAENAADVRNLNGAEA